MPVSLIITESPICTLVSIPSLLTYAHIPLVPIKRPSEPISPDVPQTEAVATGVFTLNSTFFVEAGFTSAFTEPTFK